MGQKKKCRLGFVLSASEGAIFGRTRASADLENPRWV